jgi:ligand-binding sensor domain-containing protein/two-component sensor histidine kinase
MQSQEKYFIENPLFNEDLNSLKINVIFQDKIGFIWIGTENGLYRYDGYEVKEFYSFSDNNLKSRHIVSLFEDSKQRFWIGTNDGLTTVLNNKMIHYYHSNADSNSIINNYIHEISEDKEQNILVATDAGLTIIKNDGEIVNVSEKEGLSHFHAMTAIVDKKNRYWIGTTTFVNKYENKNWEIFRFESVVEKQKISNFHINRVTRFKITKNNWLWALTNIGVNIYDLNSERQIHKDFNWKFNLHDITINDMVETDDNVYLLATDKGLHILDLNSNRMEVINESNGLNGNQVITLIKDKSGFVWLGTNNGINKFYHNTSNISMIYPNKMLGESESNEIYSVKQDNLGNVLVATLTNVLVMDKDLKNKITVINQNRVKNITVDEDSQIYLSTYASGLRIFNKNYKPIHVLPDLFNNVRSINTTYVERAEYNKELNQYIVGTLSSGLNIVDANTLRSLVLHAEHSNKNLKLTHNTVYDFYYKNDILWIASHNGLDRYTVSKQKNKQILNGYTIRKVEKQSHFFWLATKNNGLLKFNTLNHQIEKKWKKVDGLIDNDVRDLIVDSNTLWVLTAKGLNRLDLSSEKISKVSAINKFLSTRQKEYTCMTMSKNSELLIGSQSGLIVYSNKKNLISTEKPKAVIKDIIHLNESLINSKFKVKEHKYQFPPEYSSLSIEFSCLDFYEPTANHYQYKLEGLNDNWIHSGTRNYVSYPQLEPGSYKLLLKASNSFGAISDLTELSFVILKPFYLTTWFFILTSILLILVLYLIYQSKNRRNKEILKIRRKIASDLHDQIGSTLTEITLLSEMAQVSKVDLNEKLSKIEEKSRRSISEMSDLVWSIDSAKDNWDELINRIKDFSLNLLSYHDITCRFRINSEAPKTKLDPNFRQHLYLMFKEILHNVIKHSASTEVEIEFIFSKKFSMKIKDNGIGFDKEKIKSGNGLRNLEIRATELNGKLLIENNQGTIITFTET